MLVVSALFLFGAGCPTTSDDPPTLTPDDSTNPFDPESPPTTLPDLWIETAGDSVVAGGALVTTVFLPPYTAVLVDGEGRYRWWYTAEQEMGVRRAVLARDGHSVLVLAETTDADPPLDEPAEIRRVDFRGEVLEVFPVFNAHHDLIELEDGTIATLVFDYRDVDGTRVAGDALVELYPDGDQVTVWSSWDDLELPSIAGDYVDWTHANAVRFDPSTGLYHVSLALLDTVVSIDPDSGEVVRFVGGATSDVIGGPGAADPLLDGQHGFDVLAGGERLVVFDNRSPDEFLSRVVELNISEDGTVADEVWSVHPDPLGYSFALGDVTRLADDRTLISWGSLGQIEERDTGGNPTWRLSSDMGGALGYLSWADRLPAELQ